MMTFQLLVVSLHVLAGDLGTFEQTLVSISHHVLYAYNSPSSEESVRGLKETLGIPPKIVFLMPSSSDGSWFAEQAHTILPIVEGHPRANWETISPACIESVLTIISSPSTDLSLSLVLSSRPTARYPWVLNPTLANRLAEVKEPLLFIRTSESEPEEYSFPDLWGGLEDPCRDLVVSSKRTIRWVIMISYLPQLPIGWRFCSTRGGDVLRE
ncbi:hypothetical protein F2Q70_00043656 [Brassica cretica]|uniref:Uncharacterized protein n=1 Tax=Brassica cretica TaxID=69181 RepID=A0A8S9KLW7_BRACR|nr:hypothetical protein F2Q70_00043656 [Brassica cretica]